MKCGRGLLSSCEVVCMKAKSRRELSCTTGMDYLFKSGKGRPNGTEVRSFSSPMQKCPAGAGGTGQDIIARLVQSFPSSVPFIAVTLPSIVLL